MPQLDGRVFSRLQQYEALPSDLKDEVSALVDYLTTTQRDVFGLHHANLLKTVRSVRAKPLTEKITAWLLQKETLDASAAETVAEQATETVVSETVVVTETADEKPAATEDKPSETEEKAAATETTEEKAPAAASDEAAKANAAAAEVAAKEEASKAKEVAAAKAKADQAAAVARLAHAKKLLEALVLKGFITPYKESEKVVGSTPESFTFKDSELFVPLASDVAAEPAPSTTTSTSTPSTVAVTEADAEVSLSTSNLVDATESATPAETMATTTTPSTTTTTTTDLPTTVWDLVDGAVFAGALKRKAGFLAPLTQGKDVYVVVNARRKTVTFFETDVGRQPLVTFNADGTSVAFDNSHFALGVKVWSETLTELLNATTKLEREALVHALLAIGLTYDEKLAPSLEKVETIYDLSDTDIDGQEVPLSKYKGKVLVIVNVSSKCGLTPTNYPELVTLHEKYQNQGFEVLGFPCNQFMGQEPGTHDDIKAFVQQYNVNFPLFAKGDVNGVETRPVFAFLKHKLPATYIQWNFTKFLVDRNGVPVKRFGPMELPLSFEDEITKLLAEEAKVEAVETPAEAAVESNETTETKGAVAETVPAAVEPTPAAAPVEEVKAPVTAEAEKPVAVEAEKVAEPVKAVEPPVETKVETPVKVDEPTPEAVVEQPKVEHAVKTEEAAPQLPTVAAPTPTPTPAATTDEVKPATAAAPQMTQGFTSGNEPTTAP